MSWLVACFRFGSSVLTLSRFWTFDVVLGRPSGHPEAFSPLCRCCNLFLSGIGIALVVSAIARRTSQAQRILLSQPRWNRFSFHCLERAGRVNIQYYIEYHAGSCFSKVKPMDEAKWIDLICLDSTRTDLIPKSDGHQPTANQKRRLTLLCVPDLRALGRDVRRGPLSSELSIFS